MQAREDEKKAGRGGPGNSELTSTNAQLTSTNAQLFKTQGQLKTPWIAKNRSAPTPRKAFFQAQQAMEKLLT